MDLLESQSYTADQEAAHLYDSLKAIARRGPKPATAITEWHLARGPSSDLTLLPDDPSEFRSIVIRDDFGGICTGPASFDLAQVTDDPRVCSFLPILIRDPHCTELLIASYATMVELTGRGIEIRCYPPARGKWCEWAALTFEEALLHARFEVYACEMTALWRKHELAPIWCYARLGARLCIAVLNAERRRRLPLDHVRQYSQLQLPFSDGTP